MAHRNKTIASICCGLILLTAVAPARALYQCRSMSTTGSHGCACCAAPDQRSCCSAESVNEKFRDVEACVGEVAPSVTDNQGCCIRICQEPRAVGADRIEVQRGRFERIWQIAAWNLSTVAVPSIDLIRIGVPSPWEHPPPPSAKPLYLCICELLC